MIELKLKFDSYMKANRYCDLLKLKTQNLNDEEQSVLSDVIPQIEEQLFQFRRTNGKALKPENLSEKINDLAKEALETLEVEEYLIGSDFSKVYSNLNEIIKMTKSEVDNG